MTNKVLKYDKNSCQMILEGILHDKEREDARMETLRAERESQRRRLEESHNKKLQLEESCGVTLGINNGQSLLRSSFNNDHKRKLNLKLNDTAATGL